jgi:Tol biopolymer transport system component
MGFVRAVSALLLPVAFLVGDGSARSSVPTLRPVAGSKIAFTRGLRTSARGDPETASVHVLDLRSSRETRLGGGVISRPRWSPDGTLIAFITKHGGVYVVRPDGTGRRRIVSRGQFRGSFGAGPQWSPDGTKLAFIKGGQLRVVHVATRKWQLLVAADYMSSPTWSPDGKWIAFFRAFARHSATYAVRVERPRSLRLLDGHAGRHLAWSPDGSALVSGDLAPAWGVYVTPVDGSGRYRVADGYLYGGRPWSPDGKKIVYKPPPPQGLFVMNRDGSGQTRLTNDGLDSEPSWAADGRSIVFVRGWPRPGLFAVKPDGTGETRLNEDVWERGQPSIEPEWQPLAAALSLSSQTRRQTRAAGAVRYTIKVRNGGSAPAEHVVVRARPPRSAQVVGRQPAGACTGGPSLICRFRRIAPNAAATVALALRLRREGPARTRVSVSTTTFEPNQSDNEVEIRTSPSGQGR